MVGCTASAAALPPSPPATAPMAAPTIAPNGPPTAPPMAAPAAPAPAAPAATPTGCAPGVGVMGSRCSCSSRSSLGFRAIECLLCDKDLSVRLAPEGTGGHAGAARLAGQAGGANPQRDEMLGCCRHRVVRRCLPEIRSA